MRLFMIGIAMLLVVCVLWFSGCSDDNATQPQGGDTGGLIVFGSTINDVQGVYGIRSDGTQLRLISVDGREPAFEPFGNRIVFVRGGDIYTMQRDGSGVTAITNDSGTLKFSMNPSFSWDGRQIALVSGPVILLMGLVPDSGGEINYIISDATEPMISPQGDTIAYVHDGDIWLADMQGGNRQNLTPNSGGGESRDPAFSPDGSIIAFSYRPPVFAPVPQVQIINLESGQRSTLIDNASAPCYDPAGNGLAFVRDGNIYVANNNASAPRQLTSNAPIETYERISWGGE